MNKKYFVLKIVNESSTDRINYLTENELEELSKISTITGMPQSFIIARAIKQTIGNNRE